jgi:hypothetical protein
VSELRPHVPRLDKIRFAVGTSDGPRSSWWFVQIEDKGDVYVSTRSLGGYMKLSLHRIHRDPALDRYCQFGFTPKQIARMKKDGLPPPTRTYMFRWQRPPSPPSGALHVTSIIIPTDLLNHNPPPISSPRPKFLFEPAASGHALEFLLFYSLEPAIALEQKFQQIGVPIVYKECSNGETIHFIGRRISFDSAAFRAHDWNKTAPRPLSRAAGELEPGASLSGLTAVIANDPLVDGYIRLIEASNCVVSKRPSGST